MEKRNSTHPRGGTDEGAAGSTLEGELAREAEAAGFDVLGILDAAAAQDHGAALAAFVDAGRHGDMAWMQTTAERRGHPLALWAEARSVVMLGMNCGPAENPLAALAQKDRGVIASYARGKDYHTVVGKRLKQVAGWLHKRTGGEVKVFVDTAPLMEKPLAAQAGIGWQGRHTNLVSRDFGSWLLLGAILTEAQLVPTAGEDDHCGSCRSCIAACPTGAIDAPYRLDARRCISYLTIEYKGHIAKELRPLMGNRIFGCDDCLAVCPWNKYAQLARETRFHARTQCDNPPLADLVGLTEAAFRERFQGTPVKRATRDGFQRNVLIAAGNSDDFGLIEAIRPLLQDVSAVVRGAAVWALARLLPAEEFQRLAGRYQPLEPDAHVQAEWREGNE